MVEQARRELAGKDLACWCRPGDPCHGDVWLDVLDEVELHGAAAGSARMGPVTLGERGPARRRSKRRTSSTHS
ncbi:DUF4326 domain-containing protein [Nonomuraea sp. NPDC049714]|uniref:DUF4326 domain-containing protein n=1 Tax=Nonomuraea sp. NPDC049714 TaxID=3364357 RepID=UPI0037A38E0A